MRTHCKHLLLVLLLACNLSFAGQEPKKDDVTKLITAAKFLEQNPLDKRAKGVRQWAVTWIIATDKVSVVICATLAARAGDKYKYSTELFGQYTIGMAAFKLANPGKDEASAQLAGYESTLISYEAILQADPKAKNSFMDELLTMRSEGTLAQFAADSCKDKK